MNGKVTVLGKYNVYIGPGSLSKLPNLISSNNYSCIVLITDIFVEKYCLKQIEKILPKKLVKIIIRPGEQFKNIATVQDIWQKLLLNSCDRRSLIINLGGGVILDIGGFAASTYMRGLDFLNIPTTPEATILFKSGSTVSSGLKATGNIRSAGENQITSFIRSSGI